jgi:large conductance mechanosensitive channel
MMGEFMGFLKAYGVIGLAIAVIIGAKVAAMIGALVDGIIMPLVGLLIPGGDWRTMGFNVGSAVIKIGPFLGAAIDFVIVAFLVFWFAKKVLKEETVAKK